MAGQRFFSSTRGRILAALQRRGPCTVADLCGELGLTKNAVRQHLTVLERDGLLRQESARIGPSKPSFLYSLTDLGEHLFPKGYHTLLLRLIGALVEERGRRSFEQLLERVGRQWAEEHLDGLDGLDTEARVARAATVMKEEGGMVEWEAESDGAAFSIKSFGCPFAAVVQQYPQLCRVHEAFLARLVAPARVETMCRQSREAGFRCHFRL
ncbi:MAG: helix-turn-helix domain-containing protein, partial [Chloroflexota bacterium]|nr:helix-turn-helix domain-containing protein [Chloroflexota bacterium]